MPSQPEHRDTIRRLLEGLSDLEIREMCIEALRRWWRSTPPKERHQFAMHGALGLHLVPLLAERKGLPVGDANQLKEPFSDTMTEPWMIGVTETVWWFARAGLAVPLSIDTPTAFPITFLLTGAGARFLSSTEDHPLLPGFLERVRSRCPGLPDGVMSLLADAQRCLDAGLVRPAIVVTGLAYETAAEAVAEALVAKGHLAADVLDKKAAIRLQHVNGAISKVFPGKDQVQTDKRYAAEDACSFANVLRRRRNDAAHTAPAYGFEDREEAEELLVSAGRHLPNLWALAT